MDSLNHKDNIIESLHDERGLVDASVLINEYIADDYERKNNANETFHIGSLQNAVIKKVFSRDAMLEYTKFSGRCLGMFESGDIYIHNFDMSKFSPYCAGWDIKEILKSGLDFPTIKTNAAKHLNVAVDHLINFIYGASQEWQGAIGFNNFDIILAPYVRELADGMAQQTYDVMTQDGHTTSIERIKKSPSFKKKLFSEVKQDMQRFIYNCNFPGRAGFQAPFVNITLNMGCPTSLLDRSAYPYESNVYSEFVDECHLIDSAIFEVLMDGDKDGRPFTFPIPTILITTKKPFDWDRKVVKDLFNLTAKRGSPYFMTVENDDVNMAMCCHLKIDYAEIQKMSGGVFAIGSETGSIGVATINLPRIGYEYRGRPLVDVFERIKVIMNEVRIYLKSKRGYMERSMMELDLMPITRRYMKKGFKNHFSTFGIVGGNEFCLNYMHKPIEDEEASNVIDKILEFITETIREFQVEDKVLYNFEATPAENASRKLAYQDYKKFVKRGTAKPVFTETHVGMEFPEDRIYFFGNEYAMEYTADTGVDKSKDVGLLEKAIKENRFAQKYTGGHVIHFFLGEEVDPDALIRMSKKFAEMMIPYFSWTPSQTTCPKCRKSWVASDYICPTCGTETEVSSRVVGYYRNYKKWNPAKQYEFFHRHLFGKMSV